VAFYAGVERAIRARVGGGPAAASPVPLEAGVATLEVIEAARRSAAERTVIAL
jgi:hypothetical protein